MGEEAKVESTTGVPAPPVPSKVGGSKLPPIGATSTYIEEEEGVKEKKEVVEEKEPAGVITIKVFARRPFEVNFSGAITGKQVDLAWRYMMKQYKVWKHDEAKKGKK